MPGEMNKFCVGAHRNQLGSGTLDILVLINQISKLGSSDKGEIRRIEEKDRPFPGFLQCFELYLSEVPFCRFIGIDGKIRNRLTNP